MSDDGKLIYNQGDYKNIERCEVVSPYVVRFYWKNNFAKFGTLFEAVLPKHLLEGKTISTLDAFNRAPVGNGPYKFAEWKAGEYIRLVKNENYWRGKDYPKFDEIIFYHVPDANTRLNGLRSGQYDIGQLNALLIKEAQGIPGKKAVIRLAELLLPLRLLSEDRARQEAVQRHQGPPGDLLRHRP